MTNTNTKPTTTGRAPKGAFANAFLAVRNAIAANVIAGTPTFVKARGWPFNAATGASYTGVNVALMLGQADALGITSPAFVGGGDAFDKGWAIKDDDSGVRFTGGFNGYAAAKPDEIDPSTGEVKKGIKPFLGTFLVAHVSSYGVNAEVPVPQSEVLRKCQERLEANAEKLADGDVWLIAQIVQSACSTPLSSNGIKNPFAGRSLKEVAGELSAKRLSMIGAKSEMLLAECGFVFPTALKDGTDKALNAAIKEAALTAAAEKLAAENIVADSRTIERAASKLLPKKEKPAKIVHASSTPEMLSSRRLCTDW